MISEIYVHGYDLYCLEPGSEQDIIVRECGTNSMWQRSKWREKIYKMNSLKGRLPENVHVGAQACAEEDKMIKEMSDQK